MNRHERRKQQAVDVRQLAHENRVLSERVAELTRQVNNAAVLIQMLSEYVPIEGRKTIAEILHAVSEAKKS